MEIMVLFKKYMIIEYYIEEKKSILYFLYICIYTVHLFLYECITCKIKSRLSNYCTFHISYVPTNTQKYKITSMEKKSWCTSCRSCWSGRRFSSTSHLMFSITCTGGKSPWLHHPSLTMISCAMTIPCNVTSNRDKQCQCHLIMEYACVYTIFS